MAKQTTKNGKSIPTMFTHWFSTMRAANQKEMKEDAQEPRGCAPRTSKMYEGGMVTSLDLRWVDSETSAISDDAPINWNARRNRTY